MISKLSSFLTLTLALSLLGAVTALTNPPSGEVGLSYFPPGTTYIGPCGTTIADNLAVVALDWTFFAGGSNCNRGITIVVGPDNVSAFATIAGICHSCKPGSGDIEVTQAVFQNLTPRPSIVRWYFSEGGGTE